MTNKEREDLKKSQFMSISFAIFCDEEGELINFDFPKLRDGKYTNE